MYDTDIYNKMNALITITGYAALILLSFLLLTSLSKTLSKNINQRTLGLSIFYMSVIHLFLYVFDNSFDLLFLFEDLLYRDYIISGYIALVLFIPMYLTSFDYFKKIFTNWRKIHKIIYVINIFILIHIYYVIKADYTYLYIFSLILLFIILLKFYKYNNKYE